MKIVKVNSVDKMKNPHGIDAKKLYDTEHAQTMHLTLQPGEALKSHMTPVDVFFYILEGTGIVEIGDEREEVSKDTLVESPANIPHCLYNESNSVFRVLVVKAPRPKSKTIILK
jgi:mannose-6-phosphate isomerase-like protein (cupin superfamily)